MLNKSELENIQVEPVPKDDLEDTKSLGIN